MSRPVRGRGSGGENFPVIITLPPYAAVVRGEQRGVPLCRPVRYRLRQNYDGLAGEARHPDDDEVLRACDCPGCMGYGWSCPQYEALRGALGAADLHCPYQSVGVLRSSKPVAGATW